MRVVGWPGLPLAETPFSEGLDVAVDHHVHQVAKVDGRFPAQLSFCFGSIALEQGDLGGPVIALINDHVLPVVEPGAQESELRKISNRMGLPGCDDKVVGFGALEHAHHGFHVIAGKAPVAAGLQVAKGQCSLRPALMRATLLVILRVTNSKPRRGDWWLKRGTPLHAKIPYDSRKLRTTSNPVTLEMPYGDRGWKGVDSVCGVWLTLPNISLVAAK